MVDIRTVTEADVGAYAAASAIGFHGHPSDAFEAFVRARLDGRALAAFDGAAAVGTARSFAVDLTLPGGSQLPAAAVSSVTVTATHRRRGILRAMMRTQLESVPEPVAILVASEAPIYGRFGYGPVTQSIVWRIDTRRGLPGAAQDVRLCSLEAFRSDAPDLYDRFRRSQPGAITRSDEYWDIALGIVARPGQEVAPSFFALTDDGYVRYRINGHWDFRVPDSSVEVVELVALTPAAYRSLWHHVMHIDWVTRVDAENRAPVEALPELLPDRRAVREADRSDLIWLRLLDIPAALSARSYEQDGRLVLEVVDGFFDTTSRVVVDTADGCTPTTAEPDLTLTVADLSAAYLGGTPLWPAHVAGRVAEHTDGAVSRFDRMFMTTVAPWCTTWF